MTSVKRILCHSSILIAVNLCLSVFVHGQTPEVKTKATASISGRVTVGDKPAPGIVVGVGKTLAVSDADGRYRISGLTEGELVVIPFAPLYVIPGSSIFGTGKSVNVAAGEAVDGIDFKLTKGGVISGRITDADGHPIIEESVSLLPVEENGNPTRQQIPRGYNFQMYQTDDRGVYRIYGLPAGHYKVSVGDEAGRMAGLFTAGYYERTYFGDTTDRSKATTVDLNEGSEARNININIGHRSASYTVSGRIVEADTGQPLPGVQFGFGLIQNNQNSISGTVSPATQTNSLGEFRLEGVMPGKYATFVMPNRNAFYTNDGPNVYSDPVPFEVIDSDVTNVEVKAQRTLSVSGVIVPDGISNRQVLSKLMNLRIVGMSLTSSPDTIRVVPMARSSSVAPDGSFQIEGLRPGRVSLSVASTSDFDGNSARGFNVTRIERDGVPTPSIELQPGQNATGVRLFLTYGTSVIRGQLKIEGGTLPGGGTMLVTARREGAGSGAQIDSRGQFVIKNLSAGTYTVEIHVMGLTQLSPEILGQLRQTVTVADDSESQVLFTLNLSPKEGP